MFYSKPGKPPPLWIYDCYPLLNDSKHSHQKCCKTLSVLYEFYESSHEKLSSRAGIVSNGLVFYCVMLFLEVGFMGPASTDSCFLDTSASTVRQILLFCNALSFLMTSFLPRLAAQKHGAWSRVQYQAPVLTSNRYLSPSPQPLLLGDSGTTHWVR